MDEKIKRMQNFIKEYKELSIKYGLSIDSESPIYINENSWSEIDDTIFNGLVLDEIQYLNRIKNTPKSQSDVSEN